VNSILQKSLKIISSIILGAILSGLASGFCWYLISFNFYEGTSNGIINYSKEGGAAIWAVLGTFFGAVGGAISGSIISSCNFNKDFAALTGFFVHGLFPFIIFVGLSGENFVIAEKYFWFSLFGQFIVGAVVGLIIALFCNCLFKVKNGDLR
jgi:hypothetical protein